MYLFCLLLDVDSVYPHLSFSVKPFWTLHCISKFLLNHFLHSSIYGRPNKRSQNWSIFSISFLHVQMSSSPTQTKNWTLWTRHVPCIFTDTSRPSTHVLSLWVYSTNSDLCLRTTEVVFTPPNLIHLYTLPFQRHCLPWSSSDSCFETLTELPRPFSRALDRTSFTVISVVSRWHFWFPRFEMLVQIFFNLSTFVYFFDNLSCSFSLLKFFLKIIVRLLLSV